MANPKILLEAIMRMVEPGQATSPVPQGLRGPGPVLTDSVEPNALLNMNEPPTNLDPTDLSGPLDPAFDKGGLSADIPDPDFVNPDLRPPKELSGIDFEGTRFDEEVTRIRGIKERGGNVGNAVTDSVAAGETNAYIQDVVGRFRGMFDVDQLSNAQTQGSTASRLRDGWKKLSQQAQTARNPNVTPEVRANALADIQAIDEWLSKGGTRGGMEGTTGRAPTKQEMAETRGLGDTRGSAINQAEILPDLPAQRNPAKPEDTLLNILQEMLKGQ